MVLKQTAKGSKEGMCKHIRTSIGVFSGRQCALDIARLAVLGKVELDLFGWKLWRIIVDIFNHLVETKANR